MLTYELKLEILSVSTGRDFVLTVAAGFRGGSFGLKEIISKESIGFF